MARAGRVSDPHHGPNNPRALFLPEDRRRAAPGRLQAHRVSVFHVGRGSVFAGHVYLADAHARNTRGHNGTVGRRFQQHGKTAKIVGRRRRHAMQNRAVLESVEIVGWRRENPVDAENTEPVQGHAGIVLDLEDRRLPLVPLRLRTASGLD